MQSPARRERYGSGDVLSGMNLGHEGIRRDNPCDDGPLAAGARGAVQGTGGTGMRRTSRLVAIGAVMALGIGALTWSGTVTHAQDATPAAGEKAPAGTTGGATFATVAFAPGVTLPTPADVVVVRIGLDPGARVPINATEPMAGLLLVESGTLTFRSSEPQTMTRAGLEAALATAAATGEDGAASETVPAGTDITLDAGEATFVAATASGTLRNDSQAPASGVITLFVPSAGTMAATPAA